MIAVRVALEQLALMAPPATVSVPGGASVPLSSIYPIAATLGMRVSCRRVGNDLFMVRRQETDRNTEIMRVLQENGSLTATGNRFGITRERVRQIAARNGVPSIRPRASEVRAAKIAATKRPRRSIAERFMSKVRKTETCWIWLGSRNPDTGYGSFTLSTRDKGSTHRAAYRLFVGAIPARLCVLHTCDNRACVNPEHLYLGTQLDNARDRDTRGRHGKLKLSPEQVLQMRDKRFVEKKTITSIANEFGVCAQTASKAIYGGFKTYELALERHRRSESQAQVVAQ